MRRTSPILAMIVISGALLAGLAYILQQEAKEPESYPAFSSFRTLPEGASVLYQALGRIPAMKAERNMQPLGALRYVNAAILMLGVNLSNVASDGQWFGDMEDLAGKGNRVIVAFEPHRTRFLEGANAEIAASLKHWGIQLAFVRETDVRDEEDEPLMAGWPMYFAQSPGWTTTRKDGSNAVVIERAQGKGTIVLLANSFLLSNAAMVDDRQTAFLADLIGPVHEAVFDETHFGIEETGSIAALARHYRLQGLILGLVIAASLFIWKSAAGFPPPRKQPAGRITADDTNAAFLNLLRRNIKPDEIPATCVGQWSKMYQRKSGAELPKAIDLAEAGRKKPAETYAQIQQILTGVKHNPS